MNIYIARYGVARLSYITTDSLNKLALCKPDYRVHQHYDDVIMTMLASQITSLPVVCSIVYSDVNQRKHQSSASLAFVREIHRGPVNFPHKWPVTRKMFPFDDVIMKSPRTQSTEYINSYGVINVWNVPAFISAIVFVIRYLMGSIHSRMSERGCVGQPILAATQVLPSTNCVFTLRPR